MRLHVWRAAVSLALAAGFLATPLGIAHLSGATSDACDAVSAGTSSPAAAIEGIQTPPAPHEHCFTCHWLQSLRSASPVARVDFATARSASRVVVAGDEPAVSTSTRSFPARGPPA